MKRLHIASLYIPPKSVSFSLNFLLEQVGIMHGAAVK